MVNEWTSFKTVKNDFGQQTLLSRRVGSIVIISENGFDLHSFFPAESRFLQSVDEDNMTKQPGVSVKSACVTDVAVSKEPSHSNLLLHLLHLLPRHFRRLIEQVQRTAEEPPVN